MTPEQVARHAGRAVALCTAHEAGDAATLRTLIDEVLADDPGATLFLLAGPAVAFAEPAGALSGRTVGQVRQQGATTLQALGSEAPGA